MIAPKQLANLKELAAHHRTYDEDSEAIVAVLKELDELRADNAALRAALEQMLNRYDFGDDASDDERSIYEQARAALAAGGADMTWRKSSRGEYVSADGSLAIYKVGKRAVRGWYLHAGSSVTGPYNTLRDLRNDYLRMRKAVK